MTESFPRSNLAEIPEPSRYAVETVGVRRNFGPVNALAGIDLAVEHGEFFSLLGPSGCGKTTLLRVIAGLDLPDVGRIRLRGSDATELPAHVRPVNTVFQSYALFPHLNVWDNVAFGLRMKRVPEPDLRRRVEAILALVEIDELAARMPAQLSGGQKQRVALARAVVNEPEVLLLDEPLGALDYQLRKQLQTELQRLQRRLGMTFIYVTHDQEEALAMSDRLAVMRAGTIEQLGGPSQLYDRPRTRFVAQFLGSCNLLGGTVVRQERDSIWVESAVGTLRTDAAGGRPQSGTKATVAIRPEKVRLHPSAAARENEIQVQLVSSVFHGSETEYAFACGEVMLKARRLNDSDASIRLRQGACWFAELPAQDLILLDS